MSEWKKSVCVHVHTHTWTHTNVFSSVCSFVKFLLKVQSKWGGDFKVQKRDCNKTTTSKGYYRICLISAATEFLLGNYIFQDKLLIMEVDGHVIMYFLGKRD